MSVADYGRLDLVSYGAMLVGLLIVWGQDSAVARLFFEDEALDDRRQMISQALLLLAFNCLLVIAWVLAISPMVIAGGYFGPDSQRMVALLLIFAPVSAVLSFCQGVLKWTFQRSGYIVVALGVPSTNLVLIVSLSHSRNFGPVTAVAVMTGVGTLFAALALMLIRQWLILPRGVAFVRRLVPLALPYGVIATIGAIAPLVERAVVADRFGASELGLYAAASKLASLVMVLAIAFQMGWGPFAYSIYKQADAARTYNLVLRAFAAIMCVAVLTLSAIAEPLARLLAGARYGGASLYVFPIAMGVALLAIGWITEIGIHLSKRSYLNLTGFAVFLVISLAGILILSRHIGMIGVPLGALAGQLAMLLISAVIAQRAFPIPWDYRLPAATVAVALASGLAALGASAMGSPVEPRWFFISGIAIVVAMNLLFGLNPADRRKMVELLQAFTHAALRLRRR